MNQFRKVKGCCCSLDVFLVEGKVLFWIVESTVVASGTGCLLEAWPCMYHFSHPGFFICKIGKLILTLQKFCEGEISCM